MYKRQAQDRVRSALMNAQFKYPAKRITVNLAPADLPKEGGRFDLPIAIGILAASDQLDGSRLKPVSYTHLDVYKRQVKPYVKGYSGKDPQDHIYLRNLYIIKH